MGTDEAMLYSTRPAVKVAPIRCSSHGPATPCSSANPSSSSPPQAYAQKFPWLYGEEDLRRSAPATERAISLSFCSLHCSAPWYRHSGERHPLCYTMCFDPTLWLDVLAPDFMLASSITPWCPLPRSEHEHQCNEWCAAINCRQIRQLDGGDLHRH